MHALWCLASILLLLEKRPPPSFPPKSSQISAGPDNSFVTRAFAVADVVSRWRYSRRTWCREWRRVER